MTKTTKPTSDSNPSKSIVRVGTYTRKSVDDGLDKEFTSLDAQREAALKYIESKSHEGWVALETRYDDGGYSGANLKRPGIQRLLQDVDARLIDIVVVYKLDRVSRDQLDLLQIRKYFQDRGVRLVSVTQDLDETTPTGKFHVGLTGLLGEHERFIAVVRTKDRMKGMCQRGEYIGGWVPLGYDLRFGKLYINEEEAPRVREMYQLYLTLGSVSLTCAELERRGWRTKSWTTLEGKLVPSRTFNKNSLTKLLRCPYYAGKTRHSGQFFKGRNEAIVDIETWNRVQAMLDSKNHLTPGKERSRYQEFLHQLVYCGRCGSRMTYTPTKKRKTGRVYFYFVCQQIRKKNAAACPDSQVSAQRLEALVLDKIRALGMNPEILRRSLEAAENALRSKQPELQAILTDIERELERLATMRAEIVKVHGPEATEQPGVKDQLESLDRQSAAVAKSATELRQDIEAVHRDAVDAEDLRQTLNAFGPVWENLRPAEKMRVMALLIERVTVDVPGNTIEITFRDNGIPEIESPTAA